MRETLKLFVGDQPNKSSAEYKRSKIYHMTILGGHLDDIVNKELFFLGEGESVDSLGPHNSTNTDEKETGVVEDPVNHASPLVNPQTVVQVEHLLPLLQLLVSWVTQPGLSTACFVI